MKRSETVLVYAVTAVLAVILLVAVVFGGDPEPVTNDRNAAIDELMYDSESDDSTGTGEDSVGGGNESGPSEGTVDPGEGNAENASSGVALRVQSAERQLAELLGPSEVVEGYTEGDAYRRVVVSRGDTFDELLLDWTGSTVLREQAVAQNEHLVIDSLRIGQQVLLPWVAPEVVLQRLEDRNRIEELRRRSAEPAVEPRNSAPAVGRSPEVIGEVPLRRPANPDTTNQPAVTPPATRGEAYTVKKGESLWVIAERKVGAGRAAAYVNEIVAANPAVTDPSKVGEGQEIVLP